MKTGKVILINPCLMVKQKQRRKEKEIRVVLVLLIEMDQFKLPYFIGQKVTIHAKSINWFIMYKKSKQKSIFISKNTKKS